MKKIISMLLALSTAVCALSGCNVSKTGTGVTGEGLTPELSGEAPGISEEVITIENEITSESKTEETAEPEFYDFMKLDPEIEMPDYDGFYSYPYIDPYTNDFSNKGITATKKQNYYEILHNFKRRYNITNEDSEGVLNELGIWFKDNRQYCSPRTINKLKKYNMGIYYLKFVHEITKENIYEQYKVNYKDYKEIAKILLEDNNVAYISETLPLTED